MRASVREQRVAVAGVDREGELAQLDCSQRVGFGERRRACRHRVGPAGERDDLARAVSRTGAVQLARRVLVEPTGVRLPDRAHTPVDAAVRLRRDRIRQARGSCASPSTRRRRRSWRRRSRRARTALHRGCVRTRVAPLPRPAPVRGDRVAAFGFEVDDPLHGLDERERAAHAVAAHRHQVREVAEQCGEHVADERDPTSGSQTTSESMVSPPGTLMSSTCRSPHANA